MPTNQVRAKTLVVIPDDSAFWILWCIDYIISAIKMNKIIVILDLREFTLERFDRNSRHKLYKLSRKNRIESILQKTIDENNIELVLPNKLKLSNSTLEVKNSKNLEVTFLNGLDSQYFEEVGERIVNESQIDPRFLSKAKSIFRSVSLATMLEVREKGIERVIIPGGRTLVPAAVILACEESGVPCTILEATASDPLAYLSYPTNFRHNNQFVQSEINRNWIEADNSKYETAKMYLNQKLFPKGMNALDFSKSFNKEITLKTSPGEKVASIFVGTGFEMVPTEVVSNDIEISKRHQEEKIRLFCRIAKEENFKVVLRGHPPTIGRESLYAMEDKMWSRFCEDLEIIYIPSNSGINSYSLMRSSNIVAIYVSSAGIDSIILGVDTLVLGNADFAHLVPDLCAFDEKSIRRRLRTPIPQVDIQKIYPYAYFMAAGGVKVANASISSKKILIYWGNEVGAPRIGFLTYLLKRLYIIFTKRTKF